MVRAAWLQPEPAVAAVPVAAHRVVRVTQFRSASVALVVAMRRVKAPSVSSTEGSCELGSRAPAARIHLLLETDGTSDTLVADSKAPSTERHQGSTHGA
jgi:hypothetical protein